MQRQIAGCVLVSIMYEECTTEYSVQWDAPGQLLGNLQVQQWTVT